MFVIINNTKQYYKEATMYDQIYPYILHIVVVVRKTNIDFRQIFYPDSSLAIVSIDYIIYFV